MTPSQHLAQEALLQEEGGQKSQFEEIIPESYHDFGDVFSKEAFAHLPPQKPWDHTIKLVPEAQLPRGHTFPLSSTEQRELNEFLHENLFNGWIHPSKSLTESPVF